MTANRLLGEGGELIRFCQPVAIVLRRRTAWHITVKGFVSAVALAAQKLSKELKMP